MDYWYICIRIKQKLYNIPLLTHTMIGDVFEFNGKSYKILRDVSFGEFRNITKLQNSMKDQSNTPEQNDKDVELFSQMLADFLESMLGLKQEDINKLSLNDASELFGNSFTLATQVKKKSEITLESPLSQETPKIQP